MSITTTTERRCPLEPLRRIGAPVGALYDPESRAVWIESGAMVVQIGHGLTREAAIRSAINTLSGLTSDLWIALKPPHESARPCGCDPGANHICDEHGSEASR